MHDHGLRQDWVAAQVGLTPDHFAHIIAGRRPVPEPEKQFYVRLAKVLRVKIDVIRPSVQFAPDGWRVQLAKAKEAAA